MNGLNEHYSKIWLVYTVAVVISWARPIPIPYFHEALLVGFVVLCIMWFRRSGFSLGGLAGGEFLCDSCKLNYGSVCTRPERPNAKHCPDYRRA